MNTQQTIDPDWAWAPYHPSTEQPWTLALAAHLYRRTAFGVNWTQLQQALASGPQKALDSVLTPPAALDAFNDTYDAYERALGQSESAEVLGAWWLRRMLLTPFPLVEKMTLFWHSHFAVNNTIVKNAAFMRQYTAQLRQHALGSFETLVLDMCHDPAMLIGLGCIENRKSRPNDKMARVVIENFTVGTGVATAQDSHQVARAFTGNFVRRGRFQFIDREHDRGSKRVFGQTGHFRDTDVIRILLEQRAGSEYLIRKLYTWLISETHTPATSLMEPLVDSFAKDYDISKLVDTMLRSNLFFSGVSCRQRIKCPVEYALGIVTGLEGMVSTTLLAKDLAEMGQHLYYVPTLKGWQGSFAWINKAALIQRANLAHALLQHDGPYKGKLNTDRILTQYDRDSNTSETQFLTALFLQEDTAPGVGESTEQTLYSIVTRPAFHLA